MQRTTKSVIPRERSESRNPGTDFSANVAASAKILRLRSINPADLFHFAQDDSVVGNLYLLRKLQLISLDISPVPSYNDPRSHNK